MHATYTNSEKVLDKYMAEQMLCEIHHNCMSYEQILSRSTNPMMNSKWVNLQTAELCDS